MFGLVDALARAVPDRVVPVRAALEEAARRGDLTPDQRLAARRLAARPARCRSPWPRAGTARSGRDVGVSSRLGAARAALAALKSCPTITKMSCVGFAPGARCCRGCWSRSAFGAGCGRGSTPRNVLIVTLDTLRADRVGSYGYKGAQTPVLDALAARGRTIRGGDHDDAPDAVGAHQPLHRHVADDARGARQHRVLRRRRRADAGRDIEGARLSHRRLRRRLRPRRALGHRPGLRHLLRRLRPVRGRRSLDSMPSSGRAARWSTRRCSGSAQPAEQPFFAWVHLYDPHSPYDAAGRVRARASPPPATAPTTPRSPTPTPRSGGCWPRSTPPAGVDDTLVVVAGRPRRAARRAPRAVARLLRLRRVGADAARSSPGRASRRGSCPIRSASSTSCRPCSTCSACRRRRPCRARRCGRPSTASVRSCWPSRRAGTRATTTAGASCRRCATAPSSSSWRRPASSTTSARIPAS